MVGAARAPRKPSPFDFQLPVIIKTPHALPMYKEETQKWVAAVAADGETQPAMAPAAVQGGERPQLQLHKEKGCGCCSCVCVCVWLEVKEPIVT